MSRRLIDHSKDSDENDLGDHARAELSSELLPACYDDWVLAERERFRQLRLHALEALCERLTASRRYGEAIDAGLAAVCAESLRESSQLGVEPSGHLREQLARTSSAEPLGDQVRRRARRTMSWV